MVVGQKRGRTPFQPRWRVRPSQDPATRSCIRDSTSKRFDARPPQSRGLAMGAYTAFLDLSLAISGPVLGLVARGFGLPPFVTLDKSGQEFLADDALSRLRE